MEVGACPLVFSGLGSGGRQAASLPSRASELSSPRWRRVVGVRGSGDFGLLPTRCCSTAPSPGTQCTCQVSAAPTSEHWI